MLTSMLLKTLAAVLVLGAVESLAAELRGSLAANEAISHAFLPLAPDSAVVLNGGTSGSALITINGTFRLRDVAPGDYVLTVLDRDYTFPTLAVHIPTAEANGEPEMRPHTMGRRPTDKSLIQTLPYPLVLRPLNKKQYYEEARVFSPIDMLKQNKMILMMVAAAVFAFGMPKLLAMIDPEALKEVQANQAEMHKNLQNVQNLEFSGGSLGKLLAGSTEKASAPTSPGGPQRRRKAA